MTDDPALLAWRRGQAAREAGDREGALRWIERAHRLVPDDPLVTLTLGSLHVTNGAPDAAIPLLTPLAPTVPAAAAALAAAHLDRGAQDEAAAALALALRNTVIDDDLARLADRIGPWCGLGPDPRAVQGIVAFDRGGLRGWAWHPANPAQDVDLRAHGPGGTRRITATNPADGIPDLPPLARPRRFALSRADTEALGSPITITDDAGTNLLGSPLWPGRAPDPGPIALPHIRPPARETAIVIPVFGAATETLACLSAVRATIPPGCRIHVIDDASPDPALSAALAELAQSGHLHLQTSTTNQGFPSAANAGLRATAGCDVVLLNSDTIVSPGWLDRLRAAAYAAPDIGSVTPLSNDGSIVSYDGPGEPAALDALARAANDGAIADLPVGVGFCLYLRRDCLDQVGLLRDDLFAQGYGEETEFCLRASRRGWRHVAALDVFVAHRGAASFGAARAALQRRNQAILDRAYPDFARQVATFHAADPLFEARRRMDMLRWPEGRQSSAVLLVSHGEGGGVAEMVAARAAALRQNGIRPIVILPDPRGCRIEGVPDLRFAPSELARLAALLRDDRAIRLECHHLLGHDHAILGLAGLLGIPRDIWVHDAALSCPRIALIGQHRRYCGEPALPACETCVATLGSNLTDPIGPTALVARSAADLASSARVVVPTADTARRLRRHLPAIRPEIVPWEDDDDLLPLDPVPPTLHPRIVVVGAIGVEKGYDVLLACAADARARALPLDFVVCGHTEDDERLMAAGPVFVTGRYATDEAVPLIRAQRGRLAFVPSIWPETWCFALSRAWQAGLPVVAFDLGAPAERIRATGRGSLLPLGLPAPRINDALRRLASAGTPLQPLRAMQPKRTPCQTKPAPAL